MLGSSLEKSWSDLYWSAAESTWICAAAAVFRSSFSPSRKVHSSGGSSLANVPGSSMEKIDPKSWLTFLQVFSRASRFFSSSSAMTWQHDSNSQYRPNKLADEATQATSVLVHISVRPGFMRSRRSSKIKYATQGGATEESPAYTISLQFPWSSYRTTGEWRNVECDCHGACSPCRDFLYHSPHHLSSLKAFWEGFMTMTEAQLISDSLTEPDYVSVECDSRNT